MVPLRAILRHRQQAGSDDPARLLYSARTLADVIYRSELDQYHDGAEVIYTLTRSQPPGWTGYSRRVDAAMLAKVAWPPAGQPARVRVRADPVRGAGRRRPGRGRLPRGPGQD